MNWQRERRRMNPLLLAYVKEKRATRERKAVKRYKPDYAGIVEVLKRRHNLTSQEFQNLPRETLATLCLQEANKVAPTITRRIGNSKCYTDRKLNMGYTSTGLNHFVNRLAEGEI